MLTASAYIRILVAAAALIIGGTAVINFIVDPYGVNRLVEIPRFNDDKAREGGFARLRKPFDLWRRHYDGVALGSSQVERGIPTDYPLFAARRLSLYNAGISEERPYEQALLLKHAVAVSGIRFAIISLDFLRYVGGGGSADFLPRDWSRRRGVEDYLKSLVSYATLADSAATVVASIVRRPYPQYEPDGLLNVEQFEQSRVPNVRELFDTIDKYYLNTAYDPVLQARASLERNGFDHRALHDMLATARQNGVQLYFFITPSHARAFEIVHILGLAPLYRQWINELTCELASDARRHGGQAFPLWDFSGYNSITTDPLPGPNSHEQMRWYSDPIHYRTAVGSLIEDRLLDFSSNEPSGLGDFGSALKLDTLDAHFAALKESRQAYLAGHPDFLTELMALYRGPAQADAAAVAASIVPRPCQGGAS
jgi:hypothetical protein